MSLRIFNLLFLLAFFIANPQTLSAWSGIVGEINADVDAVQDQISTGGGDQNLNSCDNCHSNSGLNLSNNFDVIDGDGMTLNFDVDQYVPGDTYTIRMRVYMTENDPGMGDRRYRGAYRILAFGNNTGTFSNVPLDATGEGGSNVTHFVETDDATYPTTDTALSVVNDNSWDIEFDWTAPIEGTTVQFNLWNMTSNGNGTAEDVGGIDDNEGSVGGVSTLTLEGPASGTDADIPDLIDGGDGGDGGSGNGSGGGDDTTNGSSNVQVTTFSGGCGSTISVHSNASLLFLFGLIGILLLIQRLRALTFLSITKK